MSVLDDDSTVVKKKGKLADSSRPETRILARVEKFWVLNPSYALSMM